MKQEKQFVVRKYVLAKSAADAIRREKHLPVDDVWLDEDWKKSQDFKPSKKSIGYDGRRN